MCQMPVEELSSFGHFYSDIRRTKATTTCFSCGFSKVWGMEEHWEDQDAVIGHLDSCNITAGSVQCEVEYIARRQPAWKLLLQLQLAKVVLDKILSLGLIAHLLWATFSFHWDWQEWMEGKMHSGNEGQMPLLFHQ
jgi:hypothetical protein